MNNKTLRYIFIIVCVGTVILIPGYYILSQLAKDETLKLSNFVFGVLFTLMATSSITATNMAIFLFFRKRFLNHKSYLKQFVQEIITTTISSVVVMSLVLLVFSAIFNQHPSNGENTKEVWLGNIVLAIIVNLIVMAFVEAYTLFIHWKNAVIETEKLYREKADARYAALKNQVNPHFLFNSLNSLSSLIRVSQPKAIEFVDNFSKIYRYVLDSGDIMLIELKNELAFIQSYVFLQKIRFGDNLQVLIHVDETLSNCYIPPLSMQLLIENAIKHNEVSDEFPLKIIVEENDGFLIVRNTLKPKQSLEGSTGIGLKNLEERYMHFTDKKPEFYALNDEFIAKIPLLNDTEQ